MVRLGAEAEAGNRVPGRRIHLEGFVRVRVGWGGAGGVKARHCDSEGVGRIWGREGRGGVCGLWGGFCF